MSDAHVVYYETLIYTLKTGLSIIIPWKNNYNGSEDYRKGWNDCVKEAREKRKALLSDFTNITEDHQSNGVDKNIPLEPIKPKEE